MKHTCEQSERAFGRRAPGCARCDELKAGAPARVGWQADYYANKARQDAALSLAIRNHDCQASRCGIVCTAFQW